MKKFLYKYILTPLSDMKLKYKLLLSYFCLIIIPFAIFTFVTNNKVSHAIETLVEYSARQSFEQSCSFISYKLQKVIDVSKVISIDPKVTGILSQNPNEVNLNMQLKDWSDLSIYIKSFQNDDEIYNVKLYVNDEFTFSGEEVHFYP